MNLRKTDQIGKKKKKKKKEKKRRDKVFNMPKSILYGLAAGI
jgi:hypothetical protein